MVARSADTTERRAARSTGQLFVPVDDTGAAFQPELLITRFRIRQQTCGQAVSSVVGFSDRRFEIGVADYLQQRAEQLFVRAIGNCGDIDDSRGQQRGLGLRLSHFQQRHGAVGQQMFLSIHQRFRRAEGNHRAHEWGWLLIECTDLNARTDFHQTLEQAVAPRALRHQQTACTGATLAGRDECRLNDRVNRRIQIRDLINH
ncbi:hypothetical protein D3C84_547820 [compost metagenome]